jgi:glycerol-3-phosphate acyltransferase PlsY
MLFAAGERAAAAPWIIGIVSVMGHCWSPFCRFNGGKGVATTVGVLLYLEPYLTLMCLPIYVILRTIGGKRHWKQEGAIASLTTMTVLSLLIAGARGLTAGALASIMLAIVIVRHASNLRDLIPSPRSSHPQRHKAAKPQTEL